MKTYWGVELWLHALTSTLYEGECSVLRTGYLISKEKAPRYPLDKRLGGPQSRSGSGGEMKKSQPLPRIEAVIIPTELPRPS
jgi:hypothetical protein